MRHRLYASYTAITACLPPDTVRIPGHEVVGTIAELGQGVEGIPWGSAFSAPQHGMRTLFTMRESGNNNLCANYDAIGMTSDGGFAEYVRISANSVQQGNVILMSEAVDPAVAALMEPFACVLRGQNALHIQPGEIVLIIGAGPIGVMHIKLAKLRGAGRVIVSEPLQIARHRRSAWAPTGG